MTMMMITKAVSNNMFFVNNKEEKKKNGNNKIKMTTTTKNGISNDKTSNRNILTNKVQPSSSLTSSSTTTTTTVESIEPGLMILRNFVNDDECQRIAQMAETLGKEQESGFYTFNEKTGKRELNTGEARGRIYDAATKFPPCLISKCDDAVTLARLQDEEMPTMTCTHVLLNMYTTSQGLTWHRDIYENDGKSDHPVVNLCIGASCLFGFKHDDTDEDRTVVLKNGDVLLFGGPCRLIKHAVLEVLLDDCPLWMKANPCRYSFTFRDSPEVLGREEEFKFFRVSEHLVGQTEFEVPDNRKSFRGLPSLKSQQRMDSLTSTTSTRTSATTTLLLWDDDTTETTTAFDDESEVSYNWDATDDHVITTPQS